MRLAIAYTDYSVGGILGPLRYCGSSIRFGWVWCGSPLPTRIIPSVEFCDPVGILVMFALLYCTRCRFYKWLWYSNSAVAGLVTFVNPPMTAQSFHVFVLYIRPIFSEPPPTDFASFSSRVFVLMSRVFVFMFACCLLVSYCPLSRIIDPSFVYVFHPRSFILHVRCPPSILAPKCSRLLSSILRCSPFILHPSSFVFRPSSFIIYP